MDNNNKIILLLLTILFLVIAGRIRDLYIDNTKPKTCVEQTYDKTNQKP